MPFKTLEARREHTAKNRDRLNAAQREWRAKNIEHCREVDRNRDRKPYNRAWRIKNLERVKASKAKWCAENPDKVRAMKRKYYADHPERVLMRSKAAYRADPEGWYLKTRIWQKNNPEKKAFYQRKYAQKTRAKNNFKSQKRLAIQLGQTEGDESQIIELVATLKASKDTRCFYCRKALFGEVIHIDHIMPLIRGGKHAPENLCASCVHCNLSKGTKTVEEWEAWKLTVRGIISTKGGS